MTNGLELMTTFRFVFDVFTSNAVWSATNTSELPLKRMFNDENGVEEGVG